MPAKYTSALRYSLWSCGRGTVFIIGAKPIADMFSYKKKNLHHLLSFINELMNMNKQTLRINLRSVAGPKILGLIPKPLKINQIYSHQSQTESQCIELEHKFSYASVTPFFNATQNGFESSTVVIFSLSPRAKVFIVTFAPASLHHRLNYR